MTPTSYPSAYEIESSFKVPQTASNGPSNVFLSETHTELGMKGGKTRKFKRNRKMQKRSRKMQKRSRKMQKRSRNMQKRSRKMQKRRKQKYGGNRRKRNINKHNQKGGNATIVDSASYGFDVTNSDTLGGALANRMPLTRMNSCQIE